LPADFSDQLIFEHNYRDLTTPEPFDDLRSICIAPARCSMSRVVAARLQDDNPRAVRHGCI